MNNSLINSIANSSAHRFSRNQNVNYILSNPNLLPDFMVMVIDTSDQNNHKACWILELVLEININLLFPYLEDYCSSLKNYTNHIAIRSISKIGLFLAKYHTSKLSESILSEEQVQTIAENCFDWLIDENGKVAAKAYAIRTLFELGKIKDWIYPELKHILTDDYMKHSAAYKAVAREILKKIK